MKKILMIVLGALLIGGGVYYANQKGLLSKVANDPDVAQIKTNGVLKVGVDATFFPMEYVDDKGEVAGLGVDLSKEIAKEFGVKAEFKQILWEDIFNELKDGKIDLIVSSVTITPERSKTMSFSKPYFNAGQVIVVLSSNAAIKGLSSLDGLKIGVQSETTGEIEAKKLTLTKNVIGYPNIDAATSNLLAGKIDAVIVDYPVATGMVKDNSKLKLVGSPFTQEFYGIVAAKGKEGLLVLVNKVIEEMIDSGEMKKLENKWLKQN